MPITRKPKLKPSFYVPLARLCLWLSLCLCSTFACAEVRLSKDWNPEKLAHHSVALEIEKLEGASNAAVEKLDAVTNPSNIGRAITDQAFKLSLDGVRYYLDGAMFMSKTRPDEACTILRGPGYKCEEKGINYAYKSHFLFFNADFDHVGTYQFKINEPYEYFVNAMPAMGVYNKDRNELLVTVQYFPIDRKAASKISEVGSGWNRMTILFRVKAVDGKIEVEQDDTCLRNPNRIETIPDAKKALKACAVSLGGK
jgi:hypothetical protein